MSTAKTQSSPRTSQSGFQNDVNQNFYFEFLGGLGVLAVMNGFF
jgi:hypothetical protein